MDIVTCRWDDALLGLFDVPRTALPEIVACAGRFGETSLFGAPLPICGMAGDQQSAAIPQRCIAPGATNGTSGTGAVVLPHPGEGRPASPHRPPPHPHRTDGQR